MLKLNGKNKKILIIPDLHTPYEHKDSYKFLKAVKKALKPDITLNLGDEVDSHNISYHESETELIGPCKELDDAKKSLDELESIFKKMYILTSNHGSLLWRRMKSNGIPIDYLKPLPVLYNKPQWSWHDDIIVETDLGPVYFCHGKSAGFDKLAKELGCSAVQGHYHGKFSITWITTITRQIFNMFSGCLVDRDHLAFSYGRNNIPSCQLGCSYISKHGYPTLVRMNLNKRGRWDGKLPSF